MSMQSLSNVTGNGSTISQLASPVIKFSKNLFTSDGSIMSLLNPFIVEPTIFVSNSVRNEPDIMHKAIAEQVDIFCGFYTMAFQIMNELSGTTSNVYLKKLSTSSYDYALRTPTVIKDVARTAFESYHQFCSDRMYNGDDNGVMIFNRSKTLSGCFESHNMPSTKSLGDSMGYGVHTRFFELTTRRMFTIEKKDKNGNTFEENVEKDLVIPICVRAHIVFFNMDDISSVLDVKGDKNSFTQRYWKWRSGGISFKEFLLCADLIEEYRQKKLTNKSTILDILNGKTYNSTLNAITSDGKKGYEKFYNLFLFSGTDIEYIERELRGQMKNQSFSQSILTKLQAMELMVIDTEYDTGQLYLHTMPTPSTFPLSKLGKRKDNSDLNDLLKSLYANKSPLF